MCSQEESELSSSLNRRYIVVAATAFLLRRTEDSIEVVVTVIED